MADKAGVFIDGGYLKKIAETFSDNSNPLFIAIPQFSLLNLSDAVCSPTKAERFRTYYYDCMPYQGNPPTTDERLRVSNYERFIHAIKEQPRFEVRLGKLNRIPIGEGSFDFQQKGVDVLLSLDLAKLSWSRTIQRAILVTGDSDFVPAVEQAKEAGVTVEVYYCNQGNCRIHDRLRQVCDERVEIDGDFIKRITRGMYKKQKQVMDP